MVDARAAVRLAESWTGQSTAGNQVVVTANSTQQAAIADMGPTVSTSVTLGALNVERVEINLDIVHGWIGDLVVELTSAAGTVATLLAMPGDGGAENIYLSSFPSAARPSSARMLPVHGRFRSVTWSRRTRAF